MYDKAAYATFISNASYPNYLMQNQAVYILWSSTLAIMHEEFWIAQKVVVQL